MLRTGQNGHSEESESYGEQAFGETPFGAPRMHEQEEPLRETSSGKSLAGNWEFTTPFLSGESTLAGESEAVSPEVTAFSEIIAELKDSEFREAVEQLADEALEAHSDQLSGEYGDRETRDLTAERLLNDHFQPLAAETEAMLDRFFERLEGYTAESLTDMEIERVASAVLPTGPISPASEQFLGGILHKAKRLASGAVDLAKRGVKSAVSFAGNLAIRHLLGPLKKLAGFFLKKVTTVALKQIPIYLRPLAQKLSERLFSALGETHEGEGEAYEQTEAEVLPAALDVARLEAEFDVQAAQLLLTADEAEVEHLVWNYGEGENYSSPLSELDQARSQLIKELSSLQPGENAQPVMEQFAPALWPAAKAAVTILGRDKFVNLIAGWVGKLIKPLIGDQGAGLLAPAIADVGLRLFGLEASYPEPPRAVLAEALAATVEETLHAVAELPPHVLENETLLSEAVHEAFESAASSYFPNSAIKPELRESGELHGLWLRMPLKSSKKRYAKYSDSFRVDISPRLAGTIVTFGGATLQDYFRDQHGLPDGQPYKGRITLYQALPGARGSTIALGEGFAAGADQLHPLTPEAAGALLGESAGLGRRPTPASYLATPQRLHVNQRLYRIEPPSGRRRHVRRAHSELLINLLRDEIRLWLYLSEPLCQRISLDLAKPDGAATAFRRLKRLLMRTTENLKMATVHRHLSHYVGVVAEKPNLRGTVPNWLRHVGRDLGAKIGAWAEVQVAQYLRNSAEDFKRTCASHHDGVTLRIKMTRVPGMDLLRQLSHGKNFQELFKAGWPQGSPAFQVVAVAGYKIRRVLD
jgi:hypothetical protein